jgi:hypothetical protein
LGEVGAAASGKEEEAKLIGSEKGMAGQIYLVSHPNKQNRHNMCLI